MNEFELIEDVLSYQHLRYDAFLDNIVSLFKRKYADEKTIPQDRIKACLEGFYHNIRNMDESQIDKAYLEQAYKSVFPSKMRSEMRASLESRIVQALKGLVVVVAISSLLERQGFVNPCSTLSSGNVAVDTHHIPPVYQLHIVYDEFQTWLHYYKNTYHPIQLDLEEYSRLVRFYHVSKIIFKLFGKGNRLKGMYLFVGACLEGIPDPSGRIYAIGGQMTELTKRRESIYIRVTGVCKRKRTNKPNLNKPDQKNKKRNHNSPSNDESRSADQNYSADEDEQQYFSSSDVSGIDELEDWGSLASFPLQEIMSLNIAAIFAELTAY